MTCADHPWPAALAHCLLLLHVVWATAQWAAVHPTRDGPVLQAVLQEDKAQALKVADTRCIHVSELPVPSCRLLLLYPVFLPSLLEMRVVINVCTVHVGWHIHYYDQNTQTRNTAILENH